MDIKPRNINIITAVFLFIFNGIMFYVNQDPIFDKTINILIPAIGLTVFLRSKKQNIWFYSLVGFAITAFGGWDNFSGSIMFFIAIYDSKTRRNIVINILLVFTALAIRLIVEHGYLAHIFSMMIAFFFVFGHMYVRFWDVNNDFLKIDPEVEHNKKENLTPEQKEAVEMLEKGLSHQEAADNLSITRKAYSARVASLRKKFDVKTDFQLAMELKNRKYIS